MNYTRDQLLLGKQEISEGNDPTPDKASNAILCGDVVPDYTFEEIQRIALNSGISAVKTLIGQELVNFSIPVELKGSGIAGTPPELGALLQACGMTETINAGTSVVYAPSAPSASWKTIAFHLYKAGLLWKVLASKGNFNLTFPAGQQAKATFNMQGKLDSVIDTTLPASPTYQATVGEIVQSAGFSFGAFNDAVIRSFSFDSANTVNKRPDINSPKGLKGFAIGFRDPSFNVTVEAELEATHSFIADLRARTEEALDLTLGTVPGNIVTLAIPKACSKTIRFPDESGIAMYEIGGQCLPNAGNDNITITFT